MKGRLITFEGIDGSGKSTQIGMLENELKKLGVAFKTFREPGGTDLSEKIRTILLDKENIELISTAESLLFAAARAQLTTEQIKPAIDKGEFVICDRFTDSTIAYQGYGRRLNIKQLEKINYIATAGLIPDITFILDNSTICLGDSSFSLVVFPQISDISSSDSPIFTIFPICS